jgi:hypothetical protein
MLEHSTFPLQTDIGDRCARGSERMVSTFLHQLEISIEFFDDAGSGRERSVVELKAGFTPLPKFWARRQTRWRAATARVLRKPPGWPSTLRSHRRCFLVSPIGFCRSVAPAGVIGQPSLMPVQLVVKAR